MRAGEKKDQRCARGRGKAIYAFTAQLTCSTAAKGIVLLLLGLCAKQSTSSRLLLLLLVVVIVRAEAEAPRGS